MVLPLLKKGLAAAETMPDLTGIIPLLEAFISGTDDSKLGDCVAALLKALANAQDREPVAALMRGAGDDLLELLPQAIPDVFSWDGGQAMGVAEHRGTRCANCSAEPVFGPRFSSAGPGDSYDLCGQCFAFHTFEPGEKFDCHFMPEGIKGFVKGKGKEKGPKGKGSKWGKGHHDEEFWMPPEFMPEASEGYEVNSIAAAPSDGMEAHVVQGSPVLMLQGKSWPRGKGGKKGKNGKHGKWNGQQARGAGAGWAGGADEAAANAAAEASSWGYETNPYWAW